jgi:hypothetical protein
MGMSTFDQLRRLAVSYINNHLMTGIDPFLPFVETDCFPQIKTATRRSPS